MTKISTQRSSKITKFDLGLNLETLTLARGSGQGFDGFIGLTKLAALNSLRYLIALFSVIAKKISVCPLIQAPQQLKLKIWRWLCSLNKSPLNEFYNKWLSRHPTLQLTNLIVIIYSLDIIYHLTRSQLKSFGK